MRLQIAAIAALSLAASCAGDRGVNEGKRQQHAAAAAVGPESGEPSQETFALGSTVTLAGAVPKDAASETFIQGGPVFLSVNTAGASATQTVEVRWVAPNGRAIRQEERRVPREVDFVSFTTGRTTGWPTGEHRAIVVIDGRKVSEKHFTLMGV